MPDLLLELFSEEIPARMQKRAAADLQKLVQDQLFEAGFMPEGAKAFATPRRLALVVTGLPGAQADRTEERKGPRVGAPEKAAQGFLKAAGLDSLDQCEVRSDKKGEFYVAVTQVRGRPTAEVIAGFLPELIQKFPWPKSMRWGDGELRWVRPLHSILCAFDGEIVPFEIGGITAGDRTHGHRFMAPAEIQTRNFEDYQIALSRAKVVLDAEQRAEQILADARALCAAQSLELVEDAGLLAEVAGLAEWPVTLMGSFDEKFLTLPDEVLTATMKGHQKYFSVYDPKRGGLANRFVFVSNIEAPDGGAAMRAGYERVLTARLSDAWFLYSQDLKVPLEEHAKKLNEVTYFEGLGTIGDKVERVAALASEIAPTVGADPDKAATAARLAKADLVTGMVYEFPELQGLMGRYYALAQGLDSPHPEPGASAAASKDGGGPSTRAASGAAQGEADYSEQDWRDIADAIRDHYKPAGQHDDVLGAPVTVAVALADKIDTLTAFWSIGEKPTGSKDPFALRRAALGVIRILVDHDFRLPQQSHFATAAGGAESLDDLLTFFHDRLKVYLKDKGFRHDHVDAVRMAPDGTLEDDLVLIVRKLEALAAFLQTEDGANLLAAYKRAGNILKAEEKKDGVPAEATLDETLLREPAEQALHAAMEKAKAAFGPAIEREDFEGAMSALAGLRGPLDRFFEDVTVNAEDAALRANRLALLKEIISTCEQVADFSRVEG